MDEEEGRKMRLKVEAIREVVIKAVMDRGTSDKNLDLFIEALTAKSRT